MSEIESNTELVTVALASMVLVTEMLRRMMRRASSQRRSSFLASKIHRALGFMEVLLICAVLIAFLQPGKDSGFSTERLKSLAQQWYEAFERRQSNSGKTPDDPDDYGSLGTARVLKVKDGDSLIMRTGDGESVEARLFGIDAPEYAQAHGDAAKRALSAKVSSGKVGFREIDVDSYGRHVVVLYRQSRNINADMVCEGHAWWYRRHARREKEFEDCEATARADRLGLWRDDDPEPPWRWRRERRP